MCIPLYIINLLMLNISAGNLRDFQDCPSGCDHKLFISGTCSRKAFVNKGISVALMVFCFSADSLCLPEGDVSYHRAEAGQHSGDEAAPDYPASRHE